MSCETSARNAMETLLTSEPSDARTACAWALVNQVVPVGELDTAVGHWADIILSRSPAAIRVGKETFYRQIDRSLQAAYDVASETMSRNALLEDAAARMDAVLQKRPPTGAATHLTSGNAQTAPGGRFACRRGQLSALSSRLSARALSDQLSAGRAEHSPHYGS